MMLIMNGQEREFPTLAPGAKLVDLIAVLGLKGDRVAVEHNGAIVSRTEWDSAELKHKDKLEVVHFVGGGTR